MKVRFLGLFLLGLAGCTTIDYAPPSKGQPTAQATFTTPLSGGGQLFRVLDNEDCGPKSTRKNIAVFAPLVFGMGDKGPVTIPAGQRFYLYVSYDGAAGPFLHGFCGNIASFTPEAEHSYRISQDVSARECRVVIRDQATGMQPASFLEYPMKTNWCLFH